MRPQLNRTHEAAKVSFLLTYPRERRGKQALLAGLAGREELSETNIPNQQIGSKGAGE